MDSLAFHKKLRGKIEVISRAPIENRTDLSLAYTPGVAEPCKEIAADQSKVYEYTRKGNMVGVFTDGTAVLGLGDIGPYASLPVMEGKAVLMKEFADVDAFPIAIDTTDVEEFIKTVKHIAPMFGAINLEDISAPRCFEIERRLQEELDIPVFHDDQHGTAIVVLAGLINALKIVEKKITDITVVINGVGAAGVAIAELLHVAGVKNIRLVDSQGGICSQRNDLNEVKAALHKKVTSDEVCGDLLEVLAGTDVFIGVSKGNILEAAHIKKMNTDPIIFALANPIPEIMPDIAHAAGAAVVATGRSDFPNQINNVLAFPGIFRGLLDGRIPNVDEAMKLRVAHALAAYVTDVTSENIIPDALDKQVAAVVARAVQEK